MELMADVLFNDPTPHQFNNYKNSVDKNDINNHQDDKKQYLLAKLYLEGNKKFSIPKNCDKALQILLALSKAHIADADYTLFTMYYHGNCVERDIDKARSLLEIISRPRIHPRPKKPWRCLQWFYALIC